ncbi:MAG: hypothetical protein QXI27_03000 [Nitrososphaerota archaeon]
MGGEERAILYDYFYGNLTQRELAKKYRKSLRDISNIIKSFKSSIQQPISSSDYHSLSGIAGPRSSYSVSQQNFTIDKMKVAEVIVEFLENLESILAEKVEVLLDESLMYYRCANVYASLGRIVQAKNLIGQTLAMITSKEFADLIREAISFEKTIGWYARDCRRVCKEKAYP